MKASALADLVQAQKPQIKSLGDSRVRLIPACGGPWEQLPPVNHPSQQKAQDGFKLTRHVSPPRSAKVVESNSDVVIEGFTRHERPSQLRPRRQCQQPCHSMGE